MYQLNKPAIFWVIVAVSILILAWVPVFSVDLYNPAKEEAKYIRRIFADHSVGQTINTEHPIDAVEILLRSQHPQTSTLIVMNQQGRTLAHKKVSLTAEDQWQRIVFDQSLPAGHHTLTLTSPSSTTQAQAILVRFQPQSDLHGDGHMVVDGQPSYGDLGFRTLDRVPLWRFLLRWGQVTDKAALRGLSCLTIAAGLAALLLILGWRIRSSRKKIILAIAFGVLSLAVIGLRLPYTHEIEGIFGGDAFNYLTKTRDLLEGRDIFASDPRKGPLYSLLLIPGFLTADPLLWSRWVGIGAAVATTLLLAKVARQFSLGWAMALGAGALLAVNKDFIWESPSGLANTLFTALIVAATLAYLKASHRTWQWVLSILLGLIFLTRYEGGVIAVVLLPALWWRERLPWKHALSLIAVTGMIMAIPQLSLVWSGVSGIRTADDLLSDDGLSIALSSEQLVYNLDRLWRFLTTVWLIPESTKLIVPAIIVGLLVGVGLEFTRRSSPAYKNINAVISGGALLGLLLLVMAKSSAAREYFVAVPWLLIAVGLVPWIRSRPFDAIVIVMMLCVQTAVITVILPKPRYFLPLIPFMSLLMAFGLRRLFMWNNTLLARANAVFALSLIAVLFYTDGRASLLKQTEKYNTQAHPVSVMIEAAKFLRSDRGRVGFYTSQEQPIMTYLPPARRLFFSPSDPTSIEEELRWIAAHNLRYVVERNEPPQWRSVRQYPEIFEHKHTFDTIYGEAKVKVHRVHRDQLEKLFPKVNN